MQHSQVKGNYNFHLIHFPKSLKKLMKVTNLGRVKTLPQCLYPNYIHINVRNIARISRGAYGNICTALEYIVTIMNY